MQGESRDWLIIPTIHRVSRPISSVGSLAQGAINHYAPTNISPSNSQSFVNFSNKTIGRLNIYR
jgi:hypothetical protein